MKGLFMVQEIEKNQWNGTLSVVDNDDVQMIVYQDGRQSKFAGIANNDVFTKIISIDRASELLIRAVNNRTRERNYFRKYCELLQNEISDEMFDEEIDKNEDEYVISENEDADLNDIALALTLSNRLKDVKDVDDMASLFSFSRSAILKSLE